MIKVVLDTNVYLSAFLFGGKPRETFLLASKGAIELFTSKKILAELRGVLRKKFNYPLLQIEKVEEVIRESSWVVEPKATIRLIKNQSMDNHILAVSLEAKADYLINGDKKHLLLLKKYQNIKIVSPNQFIKIFRRKIN